MSQAIRYLPGAARIFMGLVFTVFGLNGFLQFLPAPPLSGGALAFVSGLAASGYFFPVLKLTEITAGVLLLSNRYVPLALTLLAPIVVNIVLFHAFLGGTNALTLGVLASEIFLAWTYRASFRAVLSKRAEPDSEVNSSKRGLPLIAREAS